jgi:hypothetical protein
VGPVQDIIGIDDPTGWRRALTGIPHGFNHTWEYCHAVTLTSGLRTFLYSFANDDARIVCPLSEREFGGHVDLVTPGGFSGFVGNRSCVEFSRHWNEFAAGRYVCGYIVLHPLFADDTHFAGETPSPYNLVHFLDLRLDEEDLLARMSRNRRREIAGGDRGTSRISTDRDAVAEFFLGGFEEHWKRKQASRAYLVSRATLSFLLSRDDVFIIGVEGEGRVEAAYVYGYTPHEGLGLFQVSIPGGERHTARMVWHAVKHLKSLGVPIMNLGGGVREGDAIAEAKRRLGTWTKPLRALKQVYQLDTYTGLCEQAGADPGDRSSYFPPFRSS